MNRQYTEKEILELKEKLRAFGLDKNVLMDWVFSDSFSDGKLLAQLVDGLEHPEN